MLKRLIRLLKQAGAPSEDTYDRNGAFSYHAETHSFAVGAGIMWLAMMTGDAKLLGLIIPAITTGLRAKDKEYSKILMDVAQEPHYALGGMVVVGLILLPFTGVPF